MANAVFNSMEDYFSRGKLRPRVPFTKFDLSHIRSMDCDMGILYPFWIEDCVPGDRFKISHVIKLQALPLKNPVFNNIKIYTYYFFCPYYLLWHHFDRFIEGGRDGSYSAELPYVISDPELRDCEFNFSYNSLWDYLGFQPVNVGIPTLPNKVSAFPFAAYQRIFRDYFMNQDVQTSSNVNEWFPADDFDFSLHDGKNYALGENTWSTPPNSWPSIASSAVDFPYLTCLRAKNWNKDYFTSGMFSPQRGPMQALGSNLSKIDPLVFPDGVSPAAGDTVRLLSSDNINWQFGFTDSQQPSVSYGRDKMISSLSTLLSTGNFTISELHLAQQIELWMERNMSVKAQYNEFLRIHFNDAPLDLRLIKPDYIGGDVQSVQISNVLQTSQSTETSPQGTLTGNGSSFGSGHIGSYHIHEYGLIMGIMCIMPEVYYNSGTDRHWTKESRYDFYFPEFADLEPQAVLRRELNSLVSFGSPDFRGEVLSYVGRYDEYRHHRSLSVGSFRNGGSTDFTSWVITRGFDVSQAPLLDNNLVCTHKHFGFLTSPAYIQSSGGEKLYLTQISHDAWASGPTVNPFIVQIGLSVTAVRPIPYVSDPSRLSM